jgi:putative tricarboxylic transport membrane protein
MNRISGIVVFFLGAAIFWQAMSLRVGTFRAPGPGFFPCLIAGILIALSFFLIIPSPKEKKKSPPLSFQSLQKVLVVYGALLAYFFTLEVLGFAIAGFLLMMFLFVVIDRQKIKVATVTAFIFVTLAYVLFNVILKGQLPQGLLGI